MDPSTFDMWSSYRQKNGKTVIGIMSGTSLDGVDAALVHIHTADDGTVDGVKLAGFEYVPYSHELKEKLVRLCSLEQAKLDDIVVANYGISEWYVYAVERLMKHHGLDRTDIDAISMHGQTIWHAPNFVEFPLPEGHAKVRATFQIGETAVVRERTGIPVIGNLRAGDIAAGGEGAPLAPYLDAIVFGSKEKGRIVQNIGGIGNATVIPANASVDRIFAFDTGPGNMIIDTIVREATQGEYQFDEGGQVARQGKVNSELVEYFFKKDPYYLRKPPKSTGREVYGSAYAAVFRNKAIRLGLSYEDTIASATALTALSIVESYKDFVFSEHDIQEVIIAGGGAHNQTLLSMIREQLPQGCRLYTSEEFGIPDDAREAIAFAVLGHESLMGRPSNMISVTGAAHPVILGNITL